ncbi:suppressor of glycerol defect [Marasmius crinis-equi]|uniref:Suppressor of glycerol defect n=1 Tax=Marasmius crinis-equi TaxID=585013 RepID=A0ABR3FI83_9AGAR
MPARQKTSTTRLPQSLLEQLGQSTDNDHLPRKRSSKAQLSRKDARKQERAQKKQNKATYFFGSHGVKRAATDEGNNPRKPNKKIKLDGGADVWGDTQPKASTSKVVEEVKKGDQSKERVRKTEKKAKPPKNSESALEKMVKKTTSTSRIRAPRTQQEKNEDTYITYLEAKLGYTNKGKKSRFDDGLDDLFDFTSGLETSALQDANTGASDDEDMTETEDEESEDEESEDEEDEDTEGEGIEGSEDSEGVEEEEWHGIEDEQDLDQGDEPENDPPPPEEATQKTTKYVPPHLRNSNSTNSSEAILKLTKQLKGLLNRMSEQNIGSILESVEELFRNNRRHDVTSTLTTLIIDGISSHSSLLDSYVVLHAAFVSSLHKIVGVEFAAYFLQNVVTSYEQHFETLRNAQNNVTMATQGDQESSEDKGKEASNLIVLLSELYNFQVISCVLLYDIIRGLLEGDIGEIQVELLLKLVRNSGHQLRQDDPSSLRDITQIVQNKFSGNEQALSSRTRFMIETLNNLKNNKVKRIGAQNQGEEAVERMKKFLSGLSKKRHVLAHEPLRVSLQDLHSAETKGKWWLVGAAWGGDPLVDRKDGKEKGSTSNDTQPAPVMASSALVKLAKKQGMNTDIRRSIFVVLMSSDDYVDACERLAELRLSEVQQRDIVRVLIHCCGNEKTYNPYYTLVCQHLCQFSHSYKITLQYCLWDFLRDMGETEVGGMEVIKNLAQDEGFDIKTISSSRMRNVAKAYAWWIAKDCINLSVLKPIDFTQVNPQARKFLDELFVNIFLSSQSSSPLIEVGTSATRNRGSVEEIFLKATKLQTLAMGILFFFSKMFRFEGDDKLGEETKRLVKWGVGVAKDTIQTGLDIVPTL